jgi:hypothetical protein
MENQSPVHSSHFRRTFVLIIEQMFGKVKGGFVEGEMINRIKAAGEFIISRIDYKIYPFIVSSSLTSQMASI